MTTVYRLTATTKKGNVKVFDTMDLEVAYVKFHKLCEKHGVGNVRISPVQ